MQHIEIIWAFCLLGGDLLSFPVTGGTEKIAELWFARGVNTQADTMRIQLTFFANHTPSSRANKIYFSKCYKKNLCVGCTSVTLFDFSDFDLIHILPNPVHILPLRPTKGKEENIAVLLRL